MGGPWNDLSLAPGVALIEASAGTGKTYGITALAVRLITEAGLSIDRLLVVTFTKAATAELRERIRRRLAEAEKALGGVPSDDEFLATFVERAREGGHEARWRRLLRTALARFDESVVATIHGFCQRVLRLHAFETGGALDLELKPDISQLREEIVDDLLVDTLYGLQEEACRFLMREGNFQRKALLELARVACEEPSAEILPAEDPAGELTIAGLERRWSALAKQWRAGWGDEIAAVIEAARRAGCFVPRQRTYTKTEAASRAARLDALLSTPRLYTRASAPSELAYFSTAELRRRLEPGQPPPAHPAIQAIDALLDSAEIVVERYRAAFARRVRRELDVRCERRGVQTYQHLLRDLAAPLADPKRGPRLAAAIRERFQAALIDEFQDTDSLQWDIFRRIFHAPGSRLFLVGDPKQAIYDFRGANVHVYLAARDETAPERRHTLRHSFRTDGDLVEAFNHLMDRPGFFADPGIAYVPVEARHAGSRLVWPDGTPASARAPLQLCMLDSRADRRAAESQWVGSTEAQRLIAARAAADIVALLERPPVIRGEDGRPIGCRDIAVIVRTHNEGAAIKRALDSRGVPCVASEEQSVFRSDEAAALQRFLEALADPRSERAWRAAAVTPMFGWTAAELVAIREGDGQGEALRDGWVRQLVAWRRMLDTRGFMVAFRAMLGHRGPRGDGADVPERLLQRPDGERRLTNLLHLAELLHAAAVRERLGLSGLSAWLEEARLEEDSQAEERLMRLERDDDAVRIVTIHRSKGLEYPIVFAPFLWRAGASKPGALGPVADESDPARRVLDLRTSGDAAQRAEAEARREAMRLLYVTLTRARHRCVVYFTSPKPSRQGLPPSPLAAALLGDAEETAGVVPPRDADRFAVARERLADSDPVDVLASLELHAAAAVDDAGQPLIAVSASQPAERRRFVPRRRTAPASLATRDFRRRGFDYTWGRHSYSTLMHAPDSERDAEDEEKESVGTDGSHGVPEEAGFRQARLVLEEAVPVTPRDAPAGLLADFVRGKQAGDLLHRVLEKVDFRVAREGDAPAALRECVRLHLQLFGLDAQQWTDRVTAGLSRALRTPLGPAIGERSLADFSPTDRLNELRFHFALPGVEARGDGALPAASAARIGEAIAAREPDDRVRGEYLAALPSLFGLRRLRGCLTGAIDLVLRVRADDGQRWYIVDYKSNRIDPRRSGRSPLAHYGHAALRAEMEAAHYYVQYHLYTVALHRFLGHRLRDYDYDRHFGGVLYLFLRGMDGPATPREGARIGGVFFDRPMRGTVQALDEALGAAHPLEAGR